MLAAEPCSLPHKLLHISEGSWDVLYMSRSHSATQLQSGLSFILQPGLFVRFPSLLLSWQMDLLWYLHPPKTTSYRECGTTDCHQLLVVSILPFLQLWYVLLPLCAMVMPSELAKCFSMDFKVLFKVLDLTAALDL